MKIKIMRNKTEVNFHRKMILTIKYMAREASQFIRCGTRNSICGEFRCSEEVRIVSNQIKGGE